LCASIIAAVACSVPVTPETARSEIPSPTVPRSVVAPSPTASPDLFTEVSLIAASGGDVFRRTSAGWVHLASLCQEVNHLLIAPDGTALLATCFRKREMDGRQDVVLHDLRSGTTRRLSGSDGLDTSGRPAWSPDGTAIAYVTADGCTLFAPGCRTRIAVLAIGTAKERTVPDGPIGELLWTALGLSSYLEECSPEPACAHGGPEPGTWLLTPDGWSHYSAHRLVSSDGSRAVLEEIAQVEGRVRSVATIERLGTVERRLTPAGVPIEQALALVQDGRVVSWRPDHEIGSGSTTGRIVEYDNRSGTRETSGTFSDAVLGRSTVLRPDGWIVVIDASLTTSTLRAYSLKHDGIDARPAELPSHRFVIVPR
jgi:hypothetical protein